MDSAVVFSHNFQNPISRGPFRDVILSPNAIVGTKWNADRTASVAVTIARRSERNPSLYSVSAAMQGDEVGFQANIVDYEICCVLPWNTLAHSPPEPRERRQSVLVEDTS